jgi:hypothetical protein
MPIVTSDAISKDKVNVIEVEGFKVLHITTKPQRLEAKVIFDKNDISQKLIFTVMDITHAHGFGCSAPIFNGVSDPNMIFLVGTILPTSRSLNKYLKKMLVCLYGLYDFYQNFSEQLDFSKLDLTMFGGIDLQLFNPEQLAAVRDQHYMGSWDTFYQEMKDSDREEEATVIEKCREFEKINNKDIGFVGHKLSSMLNMLDESLSNTFDVN